MKIVVATDFSPAAKHALRFILNATQKLNRDIVLVHAVYHDGHPPASLVSTLLESMKSKAYYDFQALLEELQAEFGKEIPLRFHAEVGHPANKVIERMAMSENADLIVTGMKGLNNLEKVFLGSVAASLAMHSRIPVMIVPDKCKIYPIEHIVDATDLYQDEIELNTVRSFAHLFGAKITMLHVYHSDSETEKGNIAALNEGLKTKFPNEPIEYVSRFSKSVTEGIESFTREHPTDLLTVFTHKRLFYERLFSQSISHQLSFDSNVALLVLKSNN